jgi:rhodanese-related sulfurtransferase
VIASGQRPPIREHRPARRQRGAAKRRPECLRIAAVIASALVVMPAHAARASESHISPLHLLREIEAGSAPLVVDVRSGREFEKGHVPGAFHMPFWAMLSRSSEIPASPDEPVVIYCEHGPRAGLAKAALRAAGFRKVIYLEGHMSAWKRAGLPREATAPPP